MLDPKTLISTVDDRLELRKCMSLYTSEGVLRPVYLVRLGGLDYVLKLSNCSIDWERKHHSMEVAALKLVRGIEGVTQLIQDYGEIDFNSSAYYAILKEYFYGRGRIEYKENFLEYRKKLKNTS